MAFQYNTLNYMAQAQQSDKIMENLEKKLTIEGWMKLDANGDEFIKEADFAELELRVMAHYESNGIQHPYVHGEKSTGRSKY